MGQGPVAFGTITVLQHTAYADFEDILPPYKPGQRQNTIDSHFGTVRIDSAGHWCGYLIFPHSLAVVSEMVQVPAAAGRDIHLMIGTASRWPKKRLKAGCLPEPVSPPWCRDRLGNHQRGRLASELKLQVKRVIDTRYGTRHRLHALRRQRKRPELKGLVCHGYKKVQDNEVDG